MWRLPYHTPLKTPSERSHPHLCCFREAHGSLLLNPSCCPVHSGAPELPGGSDTCSSLRPRAPQAHSPWQTHSSALHPRKLGSVWGFVTRPCFLGFQAQLSSLEVRKLSQTRIIMKSKGEERREGDRGRGGEERTGKEKVRQGKEQSG